ncbi:hypothetical protein CP980_31715 [Streptomyces vinaceus]|uniref:Uncharacterized protein n=1 Tax=Streptomyces vinaceus TaxID=1960 RepID=A0A5J6JNH7_STRVI|nr:hypothetical protein [Streptomyces vinaceus]QEV49038.1 hypothetical protein CP980_31715 [Streptomyces vinaceus]GHE39486.1 hypothetical protein GCM10017778_23700 [Streptomyces vinaceus]
MRGFEEAARRPRAGPGRLRRLLLLRPPDGGPAQAVRVLSWPALAFNGALAWWVSMVVDGPPAFFGPDP